VKENIVSAGRRVGKPRAAPKTAKAQNADPPSVDPTKKPGNGQ
jgi:hypothetical protein